MSLRLLVIDDLHFLRWGRTNDLEVSNHFKYIANEFPVTLLMVGVGLAAKGLFSEGNSFDDAPLAQTGRRTTPLDMQPFRIDTEQHRRQWRQLLLAIERKLVLAERFPGMLADELSDYLFAPLHRAHRLTHDADQPGMSACGPHRPRTA